jgi:hypothetical protein
VRKDDQTSQAAPPETEAIRLTETSAISDEDYEQMYHLLYAYRFGSISFLELLDQFEEILHIDASQAKCQSESD